MGPTFRLKSESMEIRILAKGAELQSVRNTEGFEYLWQADPELWPRRAPVLFPVVGRLKENRYEFGGGRYTMNQHGFARDLDFVCLHQSEQELSFELCHSENTLKIFPFRFSFQTGYRLDGNTLHCLYEVKNTGKEKLYFSLGAHPGFRLSASQENFRAKLFFDTDQLKVSLLSEGLLSNEKRVLILQGKELELTPALFAEDALVMEDAQINRVRLLMSPEGRGLELNCENWPFFGIWSKPGQEQLKFVCLEPWYGVADSLDSNFAFDQKRGILQLEAGALFRAGFRIRFF